MSVLCRNADYHESVEDGEIPPAPWVVTYPGGDYNDTTACDRCLEDVIFPDAAEGRQALSITPVPADEKRGTA